jgi:hypothetical protein
MSEKLRSLNEGLYFARKWNAPEGEVFAVEPLSVLRAYFESVTSGHGIWKWEHYFEVYERHLSKFRGREVHIVEVGIYSGGSLSMWQSYFGPSCRVYGIDIEKSCSTYESDTVKVFIGDQADRGFWAGFKDRVPQVDVLIDDGGHAPEQQRVTFEEMLPHLSPGGVYICEDIHGAENAFAHFVNALENELHAFERWEDNKDSNMRRSVCYASAFQSAIHSVHHYPFISVIEKRAKPIKEFVAPKRGTLWQPFLR